MASQFGETVYSQFQELFRPSFAAPHSTPLLESFKSKLSACAKNLIQRVLGPSPPPESLQNQFYETVSLLLKGIENPSSTTIFLTTAVLLPTLAFFVFIMSWTSRWPSWSGRFSPFSRSTPTTEVRESDYEYVRPEDLQDELAKAELHSDHRHHHSHSQPFSNHHHHHRHHTRTPSPDRDTDVLVLRNKKNSYSVHFPAHSISSGELRVAEIRAQAAKKTGGSPKRIKLFYKGRSLKDDHRLCLDEGLHNASEILCVVGDASGSSLEDSDSDDSRDDDDEMNADGTADGSGSAEGSSDKPKRRRNRRGKKKTKAKRPAAGVDGSLDPYPSLAPPAPSKTPSPHRAPSPQPPVQRIPQTPMEKLNALSDALGQLLPTARDFLADPPRDGAKREFEYKKLTETILAQILLKVDGVETEGDENARARRKELVKEAQGWLDSLDRAHKAGR